MSSHLHLCALILLSASTALAANPESEKRRPVAEFEALEMILEVNETDGDAEIVMSVHAEHGLRALTVRGARGLPVTQVHSTDRERVGLAEVLLESGEPSLEAVLRAYPDGIYTVTGTTTTGQRVAGTVTLSHELAPAPHFSPSMGELVDPSSLLVTWDPVPGAAGYVVEIENDDIQANLTVRLSPDQLSLAVPAGFLVADTEYEIGVATVSENGNIAVAEGTFQTEE